MPGKVARVSYMRGDNQFATGTQEEVSTRSSPCPGQGAEPLGHPRRTSVGTRAQRSLSTAGRRNHARRLFRPLPRCLGIQLRAGHLIGITLS
jgi:hypothetical protein